MKTSEKRTIMRPLPTTRREIEEKIRLMGDYVKIGYLQTCLKSQIDFDARKFVLLNLGQLYEAKKMFSDAGKSMRFAAEISATDQPKIADYMKSTELFVKAGNYDEAELTFRRAHSLASAKQKEELNKKLKDYYLKQSEECMKKDKRKQAIEIYEKILSGDVLDNNERADIQKKLLVLYENLGRIRDYFNLKQKIEGNLI